VTGRRALGGALAAAMLILAGGAVALVLAPLPRSPRGPEPGRGIYQAHCATCHGAAGRGDSWRARLLFLGPGDLTQPAMASLPDQYLVDLVRHGGSSLGKPGMPSFGFVLSDAEIEAVVQYVRTLPRVPRDLGRRPSPAAPAPDGSTGEEAALARRAGRDALVAARAHARLEGQRVDVADCDELDAVLAGARARSRHASRDGHGAIPVGPGRALGLVAALLGLGRARPLPAHPGAAPAACEDQQGEDERSPHGPIVPRARPGVLG
jgi:mono/diheme cytochrome c family protein